MKTFIKMIGVFFITTFVFSSTSQPVIRISVNKYIENVIHNDSTEKINVVYDFMEKDTKQSPDFSRYMLFPILMGILEANVSSKSKVKAINEAIKLANVMELKSVQNHCYEAMTDIENISCMKNLLKKFPQNRFVMDFLNTQKIILGSCIKMKTYKDEAKCFEKVVERSGIELLNDRTVQCRNIKGDLSRVFCFREFI